MIKGTEYVLGVIGIPMALIMEDETSLQLRIASIA
jgi:hypothetical protein